jgi:hypothetical protein
MNIQLIYVYNSVTVPLRLRLHALLPLQFIQFLNMPIYVIKTTFSSSEEEPAVPIYSAIALPFFVG